MADFEEHIQNLNIRAIILSSVMTAFGLVIALVWKEAIIEAVDYFIQETGMVSESSAGLTSTFISAMAVTILVTILAYLVIKANKQFDQQMEMVNEKMKQIRDAFDDEDEKE